MRIFRIFSIVVLLLACILVQAQDKNLCQSNCILDAQYSYEDKIHYVFTGSDTTGLHVKPTLITIMDSRQALVKKRKPDCLSPNIEDCMVEEIQEIPAVTMKMYTLDGPNRTTEFETRKEKIRVLKVAGGAAKVDVVCEKNRTKKLISKVQNALIKEGYPLIVNGVFDQATKFALDDFLQVKGLYYGDLTLSSLSALGVNN